LISIIQTAKQKNYIYDVPGIYHVHPYPNGVSLGDLGMSADNVTYISATVGGGLLLGYALKKVVKLISIIAGLFIAGLAYLQYHQVDSFDWNKIEVCSALP
jgi:hypothetical protein